MKTNLSLITLASLFLLVSCGSGNQTSTQLEVSRAFAVTNPSFGGGLIITGKNITTGESFSQGLTSSMSVRYLLTPGRWSFSAVGWDGGGTTAGTEKPFAGKPSCGITEQEISGSSATVSLSVTQTNCGGPAFSGGLTETVGGVTTVQKLGRIVTCNSLFHSQPTAGQTPNSVTVNNGTADNYCSSVATFPEDWHSKVKSIRIHAYNKDPAQLSGSIGALTSSCLKGNVTDPNIIDPANGSVVNPYTSTYDLRLPLLNVPFIITLFKGENCTDRAAEYEFHSGLLHNYSGFDHKVLQDSSLTYVRLFLPANDLKRGYSPLAHLLPAMTSPTYGRYLTKPAGLTYSFQFNHSTDNIVTVPGTLCSTVSGPYVTACTELSGSKLQITVRPSAAGVNTFIADGKTYTYYAETSGSITDNYYQSNRTLVKLIGGKQFGQNDRSFFQDEDDDEKVAFGYLGKIRNMFSANGAGGVLGISDNMIPFGTACSSLLVSGKEVTIFNYEELRLETYKVAIENDTSSPNAYTCSNAGINSACDVAFDKKMIIWDYKESLVVPSIKISFNCSDYVGKYLSSDTKAEGTNKRTSKTQINWNTTETDFQNQRYEVFNHDMLSASDSTLLEESRSFSTIKKKDADPDGLDMRTFSYNTKRNGTNWDESLETWQQGYFFSSPVVCYYHGSAQLPATTYGNIFTDASTLPYAMEAAKTSPAYYSTGYDLTADYPQPTFSGCATTSFNVLVNGTLDSKLISLNPALPTFTDVFGM